MRKFIIVIVSFFAIVVFILSFSELENIVQTLQHGQPLFIFLALATQIAWLVNEALLYRTLYRLMDVRENLGRLILISVATHFINIVTPSAGFGGIAVFIDDAGKRNLPRGMAAAVAALALFLEYTAFLGVLALGIVVLIRRNDLNAAEISASALMAGLVFLFGILIYIGSRSGEHLGNILAASTRIINHLFQPLLRRDYLNEATAHTFAREVAEGLSILRRKHRRLIGPFLLAVNGKALQIIILLFTFFSFEVDYSAGTIIAGFATAYLFLVMSPTPSGIGVVEGILPLALTSLRVPWEQAVVVTLTYRGITFWFPLLLGGIAFRLLQMPELFNKMG